MTKVKKDRNGYGNYVFKKGKTYCMKQKCLYTELDPEEQADAESIAYYTRLGFTIDKNGQVWVPKNTPMEYIGEDYTGWPTFIINGEDFPFSSLEDYVVYEI